MSNKEASYGQEIHSCILSVLDVARFPADSLIFPSLLAAAFFPSAACIFAQQVWALMHYMDVSEAQTQCDAAVREEDSGLTYCHVYKD